MARGGAALVVLACCVAPCGAWCNATHQCRVDSPVEWNGDTECHHRRCYCTEPLYGDRCQYHLERDHPMKCVSRGTAPRARDPPTRRRFHLLFRGFTALHGLVAVAAAGALGLQFPRIRDGSHAICNVATILTSCVLVSNAAAFVYTGAAHGFQARGYWYLSWRVLYAMWGLSPCMTLWALDVLCIFWHYSLAANKKIQHAELPHRALAAAAFVFNLGPPLFLCVGLQYPIAGPEDPYWTWVILNAVWHLATAFLLLYVTAGIARVVAHLKGAMRRIAVMTFNLVGLLSLKVVYAYVYLFRTRYLNEARVSEYFLLEFVDMSLALGVDCYLLVLALKLARTKNSKATRRGSGVFTASVRADGAWSLKSLASDASQGFNDALARFQTVFSPRYLAFGASRRSSEGFYGGRPAYMDRPATLPRESLDEPARAKCPARCGALCRSGGQVEVRDEERVEEKVPEDDGVELERQSSVVAGSNPMPDRDHHESREPHDGAAELPRPPPPPKVRRFPSFSKQKPPPAPPPASAAWNHHVADIVAGEGDESGGAGAPADG